MLAYTHSRLIAFVGVSALIVFIYSSYLGLFCSFYYDAHPKIVSVSGTVLTGAVVMIFLTYFLAVFSNPGFADASMEFFIDELEIGDIKREAKSTKENIFALRKQLFDLKNSTGLGRLSELARHDRVAEEARLEAELNLIFLDNLKKTSFCFSCNRIKKVRDHHCKSCGKCVRRMDHHCPWTGNCVGADNQKYFVQFLFYAGFSLVTIFPFALLTVVLSDAKIGTFQKRLVLFTLFFGIVVGTPIFYLFIYQIRILFANLTTVEDNILGVFESKPFDRGLNNNIGDVFGKGFSTSDLILPTPPGNSFVKA